MLDYKIRTIVTQDAEVDDQNSFRHLLLYANDIEIQGIIQTSSIFHWKGKKGVKTPEVKEGDEFAPKGRYDEPYRWTGTQWMFEVLKDYEKVYKNLCLQSLNYPTAQELKDVTKIGNIGYPGEMDEETEGSKLIKEHIMDNDERILYLQIWGGTNTIARALYDIECEHQNDTDWDLQKKKIMKKVVLVACGEQDPTYQNYIAQQWPQLAFISCVQMGSYAYAWKTMPDGESKKCLKDSFMRQIVKGNGPLMEGYATWADGKEYEGEPEKYQFGSNKKLLNDWWGKKIGLGIHKQYDFLSEGDSPTFLMLLPTGLRSLEHFGYGGIAGRYVKNIEKKNKKGEILNYWESAKDVYKDANGNEVETESMWRYVEFIQRDFVARAKWCVETTFCEEDHAPEFLIENGRDHLVKAGEEVLIHASVTSELSGDIVSEAFIYPEASSCKNLDEVKIIKDQEKSNIKEKDFRIKIPKNAKKGDQIHVIFMMQKQYGYKLKSFQRVIINVI